MSKVLLIANNDFTIYNYRLELVERLLKEGHKVIISTPGGARVEELISLGCEYHVIEMSRHGMNPIKEIKLYRAYKRLFKTVCPDIIFSFTIKPNVYGGMAAGKLRIPFVANVTGLGVSIENGGLVQKIVLFLCKKGLKRAQTVFFQNSKNRQFFIDKRVLRGNSILLPGSGVNLAKHPIEEYPTSDSPIVFSFIGRLMRDKGIVEYVEAAKIIKQRHPNVVFRAIGGCEPDFSEEFSRLEAHNYVELLGHRTDIHNLIKDSHAVVLPSYHEGMANVLLEAAACARPVIATEVPGCIETFDENISGFGCKARDVDSLVSAIEKFLELSMEQRAKMGLCGRAKVEVEFDRNIVVDKYMSQLPHSFEAVGRETSEIK